jgi:hypothetical protein
MKYLSMLNDLVSVYKVKRIETRDDLIVQIPEHTVDFVDSVLIGSDIPWEAFVAELNYLVEAND